MLHFQSNWMKESIARAVSPIPPSSPTSSNGSPLDSPRSYSPPLKRSRLYGPEEFKLNVASALPLDDDSEDED